MVWHLLVTTDDEIFLPIPDPDRCVDGEKVNPRQKLQLEYLSKLASELALQRYIMPHVWDHGNCLLRRR